MDNKNKEVDNLKICVDNMQINNNIENNNNNVCLIIYTNTDYLDIFNITLEHLKVLKASKIIIFSNQNNDLYKYQTYLYDDKLSYPNRILQCLNQLDDNNQLYDNIILCHDNDIIMSYNEEELYKIIKCIKENNIDRVGLITLCDKRDISQEYYTNNTINIDGDLRIVKNPGHWAYSVGPSIWNRRRFINLLQKFSQKDYRNIEDEEVQNYVNKNMKIYNIGLLNENITYIGRRSNTNVISFLHITVRGKFINDIIEPEKWKYICSYKDKYAPKWHSFQYQFL